MKKVIIVIAAACIVAGMFASCTSTRDCPSHDKNFFTRGGGSSSKWR